MSYLNVSLNSTPPKMSSIRRVNFLDTVVSNASETSDFYCKVFGFSRQEEDEGEGNVSYHIKDGDKEVLGVCADGAFPDWVKGWVPYIDVENYEESVAQVKSTGGKVFAEMDWGRRFCLATDPSGNPVMICEPDKENQSG